MADYRETKVQDLLFYQAEMSTFPHSRSIRSIGNAKGATHGFAKAEVLFVENFRKRLNMFIKNKSITSIYLQKIRIEDVSARYVDWLNDPEINQYLETRFQQQTLESVHDFVSNIIANDNEYLFTIRTSADDIHIGNIKVGGINSKHGVGHVSLFIGDKESWGKGYASQAIKLISEYAFNILKLRKLSAGAYQPNIASTKAFIKVGYQYDATLKNHYLLQGQPCDLVQVCLFSSKWIV